ncbi:MAG: transposase family protein, partial [Proteobacteria bacterium]|nr:transposase family protein [Pseudomonadota bacterium]
ELAVARSWRTRTDPFEADWPGIRGMLEDSPELEAKIVLDYLIAKHPNRYQESHLRTLQRRFKQWRAQEGPPKRVFFSQVHVPGEAMQTDFTWGTVLGVSIDGQPFEHMMCHSVLPYSNWEWVSVCRSESMASIRRGVQAALFQLGGVPKYHQTDNSTAATHDLRTGKRGFNEEYARMVKHFGMVPRTIAVGEKEQNGDIESANGAFKRRVRQMLLLRGNNNFATVEAADFTQEWPGALGQGSGPVEVGVGARPRPAIFENSGRRNRFAGRNQFTPFPRHWTGNSTSREGADQARVGI